MACVTKCSLLQEKCLQSSFMCFKTLSLQGVYFSESLQEKLIAVFANSLDMTLYVQHVVVKHFFLRCSLTELIFFFLSHFMPATSGFYSLL